MRLFSAFPRVLAITGAAVTGCEIGHAAHSHEKISGFFGEIQRRHALGDTGLVVLPTELNQPDYKDEVGLVAQEGRAATLRDSFLGQLEAFERRPIARSGQERERKELKEPSVLRRVSEFF